MSNPQEASPQHPKPPLDAPRHGPGETGTPGSGDKGGVKPQDDDRPPQNRAMAKSLAAA